MISISNKSASYITKVSIVITVIYALGFTAYSAINYYKTYFEKERLTLELSQKRVQTEEVKKKIEDSKQKIAKVEKSYITKEELDTRIKEIFTRMSVFDYELNLLESKKMCIDRYVLITQLVSSSPEGLQAGEGILSYLGQIKKHETNKQVYFVDYISKPKDIK